MRERLRREVLATVAIKATSFARTQPNRVFMGSLCWRGGAAFARELLGYRQPSSNKTPAGLDVSRSTTGRTLSGTHAALGGLLRQADRSGRCLIHTFPPRCIRDGCHRDTRRLDLPVGEVRGLMA